VKNPDPLSYLFDLDKESSTSSVLIERLNTNEKIQHMCTAKVITPANEVPGELLIGESCLYFVADDSMLETDLTEVCSQVFVMWHCMWLQSQLLLFKCRAFWWDWLLYVMCKIYLSSHITKVGESNGKLSLRTCPGCSVLEPYQSPDWALVSAQTGPRAEYL